MVQDDVSHGKLPILQKTIYSKCVNLDQLHDLFAKVFATQQP
jgi:hypothetical protein